MLHGLGSKKNLMPIIKGAEICIPSDTGYSLKVYRFASAPFIGIICDVFIV